MSKHLQAAAIVTAFAAILVAYLVFSSTFVTNDNVPYGNRTEDPSVRTAQPVDQEALTRAYEANLGAAIIELDKVMASADAATMAPIATGTGAIRPATVASSTLSESLAALKVDVMNLTVPEQYRQLHLDVVISIGKLKTYFGSGNDQERVEGVALLDQARRRYAWLGRN